MGADRKTIDDEVLHFSCVQRAENGFDAADFHAQDLAETRTTCQISACCLRITRLCPTSAGGSPRISQSTMAIQIPGSRAEEKGAAAQTIPTARPQKTRPPPPGI